MAEPREPARLPGVPPLLRVDASADAATFEPQPASRRSTAVPLVWAVDAEHVPTYWFPRDCPRVAVWARDDREQRRLRATFSCEGSRLHLVEQAWMARIASAELHVHELDPDGFEPAPGVPGHWISSEPARSLVRSPLGDLLERHAGAGIELRAVDGLAAARELARIAGLPHEIA